jgi:hypothetical protein
MTDSRKELTGLLYEALMPYLERLRDPKVIAETDARAAATVVKMLLDRAPADEADDESETEAGCGRGCAPPDRAEILEIIRGVLREKHNGGASRE